MAEHEGARLAREAVHREIAEMQAADAAVAEGLAVRGRRNRRKTSIVYSIRLDPGEVDALETRAASLGMKPTILARNMVRIGLRTEYDPDTADLLERLDVIMLEVQERLRGKKRFGPLGG
jgi:hypothetical protein